MSADSSAICALRPVVVEDVAVRDEVGRGGQSNAAAELSEPVHNPRPRKDRAGVRRRTHDGRQVRRALRRSVVHPPDGLRRAQHFLRGVRHGETVGVDCPVGLRVGRCPLGLQGLCPLEGSLAVGARKEGPHGALTDAVGVEPLHNGLGSRLQAHYEAGRAHQRAVGRRLHHAAARRNHLPLAAADLGQRLRFQQAEGVLAVLREHGLNGLARDALQHVVGVHIEPPQLPRHGLPNGRLAHAHESREEDVVHASKCSCTERGLSKGEADAEASSSPAPCSGCPSRTRRGPG